jgi:hypothetical protein
MKPLSTKKNATPELPNENGFAMTGKLKYLLAASVPPR